MEVELKILPFHERPYMEGKSVISFSGKDGLDENLLPVHRANNQNHYHPVMLCEHGLHLIDVYSVSLKKEAKQRAERVAEKLFSMFVEKDGGLYLPYPFDFNVHGIPTETLKAGWFSGMAQGQALSFFCRLKYLTIDKYPDVPQRIFKTISEPGELLIKDDYGNLWIEEYPQKEPCYTLNGMIFAIYGVYDYWLLTRNNFLYNESVNNSVEHFLKELIHTIAICIDDYRVKDGISYYCLKHKIQSLQYHQYHIQQLNMLYRMTGIEYFEQFSQLFKKDTENAGKD